MGSIKVVKSASLLETKDTDMYHFTALLKTHFALWVPGADIAGVSLVLASVAPGSPMVIKILSITALSQTALGLWTLLASSVSLQTDVLYHYWYDVTVRKDGRTEKYRITDPFATTVDWRVLAKPANPEAHQDDYYPAGTFLWDGNQLKVADCLPPDGKDKTLENEKYPVGKLPENDQIVIYELPTAWMREAKPGARDNGVGSFSDVLALLDKEMGGTNLPELPVSQIGTSYFTELGINAIELLPAADSIYPRQWGYGTSNFNAPDYELGFPETYSNPAPNRDLSNLVKAAHDSGIRVIADVVMAFGKSTPYRKIAFESFFINASTAPDDDGDKYNSRYPRGLRDGYGADSFRYSKTVRAYDPLTREEKDIYPARQFLLVCQQRWMRDFHIDGFRLDSVENVSNWDFVEQFRLAGHRVHAQRYGSSSGDQKKDFLVVGEELNEPAGLIAKDPDGTRRLDGIWRHHWMTLTRSAIQGYGADGDNLEWTVRKAIDCRIGDKYKTLTEAVLYLTSHDVEGEDNWRLYNYLQKRGFNDTDILRRSKLGFSMLLTAVGIPMILAGDEFGDQHDLWAKDPYDWSDNPRKLVNHEGGKQVDAVNFSRIREPWRKELKDYVSRLIKLRTSHPALRTDDTNFWADFSDGKRVVTWVRGQPSTGKAVVVVANFSDFYSGNNNYVVQNWPSMPPGTKWREATRDRDAPNAGNEGIYGWEAKVYYC